MAIETNLNSAPYYNDVDQALNNNYHRILFRPAVPVQARELSQLQDILQNQIERFGDNIFVTGSIIKGCNFSFDTNYHYVKLQDLRPIDNQPVQPVSYVGLLGYEPTSNLYAICYNYQDGFESQAPNLKTLYFKYLNSGVAGQSAFPSGSQITFYQTNEITQAGPSTLFANADVKVASSSDATGKGYAMTVASGVLFQKGHFIQVSGDETAIVSKYSQFPSNVVAGFLIDENIVTYNQDPSLLDNASGYTNFNAPGADRLQLTPKLTVFPTSEVPANNFFSLVEWQNGNIVRSFQETQYSLIGNEMAKRTYEQAGNFVIKPFTVSLQDANSSHIHAVVTAGTAYIEGHRVEQLNNVYVPVRKGTDLGNTTSQKIQTTYNNFILIGEYIGSIPTNKMATISLRDAAGNKITNGNFANTTAPGNEIGTAKTLALQYYNGTIGQSDCLWKLYLTDINMNPGKNFTDVKSVYSNSSINGVFGCADTARNLNTTSNTYITSLQSISKASLVFDTARRGLKSIIQGASLPRYVYRTISNTTLTGSIGESSLIQLINATFPYGTGDLTKNETTSVVVIPTAISTGQNYANVTPNKTGNVAITSGSANIVGTSTTFTTDYQVGDFISAGIISSEANLRRIINISNNTSMTVDKVYNSTNNIATHTKAYPINVPINIQQRNTRLTVSGNDSDLLKIKLITANGSNELLNADLTLSVHHNALYQGTDRTLESNTVVVRINTSNNSGGSIGPWCLGIPYAYKLKKVYRSSNTGILVGNITSSNATLTANTTGFSNGVSLFGLGIPAGTTANVTSNTTFQLSSNATVSANNLSISWAYYSNNEIDDNTSQFKLEGGQTEALFEHAFLELNPRAITKPIQNSDLLTVEIEAFKPKNSNRGYISVDSYSNLVFEAIPSYIDKNNREYFLRDSIDFRQFVANTAVYTRSLTTSTINPQYSAIPADIVNNPPTTNTELYVVAPDQHFQYDSGQYLGRIDKLVVNSFGKYKIIEGKPSENPVAPADIKEAMTLAIINIPPFPSYTSTLFTTNVSASYVTSSVINQNRVYTMKDIAKLDNRVKNLEYYTSLSLLEKSAESLQIISDVTGANRFKNGIFVDDFQSANLLDTSNPEFKASLSSSENAVVPLYTIDKVGINFANGTGISSNGGVIRLRSDTVSSEVPIIKQDIATEKFQCSTTIYNYCGIISTIPKVGYYYTVKPKVDPVVPVPPPVQPPPVTPPPTPPVGKATISKGFSVTTAKAGDALFWSIVTVGYNSVTVTITGPVDLGGRAYNYTEVLIPTEKNDGGLLTKYHTGGGTIKPTFPGTYIITLSTVLQSGFIEESGFNANFIQNSRCLVTPVVSTCTPCGGITFGSGLNTLVLLSRGFTSSTNLPVSNNQTVQVANNTIPGGGLVFVDTKNGIMGNVPGSIVNPTADAFNTDQLQRLVSGTANTSTSTTSEFKLDPYAVEILNSFNVGVPGIGNNVLLVPFDLTGMQINLF